MKPASLRFGARGAEGTAPKCAAHHAGAASPCGQGRMRTEARVKPGRNRPDRMPSCPGMRGRRRPRRSAGRHGTKNQRRAAECAAIWPGFPGARQGRHPRKEIPRTFKNPREPCRACGAEPGFPGRASVCGRQASRPRRACTRAAETDALLHMLVRLAPRRKSRGLQGKCLLLVRALGDAAPPRPPPILRNSLSVQEARQCAAARHSAFSSTATVHPPGLGPEK